MCCLFCGYVVLGLHVCALTGIQGIQGARMSSICGGLNGGAFRLEPMNGGAFRLQPMNGGAFRLESMNGGAFRLEPMILAPCPAGHHTHHLLDSQFGSQG